MRDGANGPERREVGLLRRVRLWFAEHTIIPLLIVCLVLGLGFVALYTPMGPPQLVVGRVQRVVRVATGKYSSGRLVYVALGSGAVIVHELPGGCAAGDPILIRRQRMLWGARLTAVACGSAAAITVEQTRRWGRPIGAATADEGAA